MSREREPVFELRIDPVTGRRVYIAEGRAGRPSDYAGLGERLDREIAERSAASCPFCEGHESETPPAVAEVAGDDGHWQVRVVPNKFPAVRWPAPEAGDGQPSVGGHEVIIESPEHRRDVADLALATLATVLRMYRDRVDHWLNTPGIEQVLVFKNVGFAAGASLEHVHSQVMALPYISPVLDTELQGAASHLKATGRCVFSDIMQEELASKVRLVSSNGAFVAFCPYAARQPFETWILPREHSADFRQLPEEDFLPLAEILQDVLRRLQQRVSPLSYNLMLHTTPRGDAHRESYHWHWELVPRTARLAGLEWGSGVYLNALSPERAAAMLRDASEP